MKTKFALIFVAFAMLLSACASAAPVSTAAPAMPFASVGSSMTNEQAGVAPAPDAGAPGSVVNGLSTAKNIASGAGSTEAAAQNRLVSMTVNLSIVVTDPQKKIDAINQMAEDLGGYLISMNMSQVDTPDGNTVPQGTISIRVPAEKLDTALSQIKTGVVSVQSEDRTGQDVTSQYVDLQSQLTNLEKAEQDLQAIMDDAQNNPGNDSTTKTQDVLNVYNQIVTIRGQIEQIEGQIKYIDETTSTSAITVNLIAEETIKPIEIGGWKPVGVARDAVQALVKFLQGFVNFIIYLVLLVLPILIVVFGPIALIIWGILSLVKRRKAKKAAQAK
ncbi:MAG: DUF4349 domain-containing protein [Anaerolineales bacterium]